MLKHFFPENRAVYGIMWKNIVQPDRQQMTIWRMRISCWITEATDIHQQCVKHQFSTAKMVKRTCHNVTLHVRCLSG